MRRRIRRRALQITVVLPYLLSFLTAATIPAGTEIQVRLTTKVSSSSTPGDKVEAVSLVPVIVNGAFLLPAGSTLIGTVKSASPPTAPDKRATLKLEFSQLVTPAGHKAPIATKVVEVDNAREKVDQDGQILGILESETLTARMDTELDKLSEKFAAFARVLQSAKQAVLQKADTSIVYDAGVELKLTLLKPVELSELPRPSSFGDIQPADKLYELVNAIPFQTMAEKPPKPSDLTNLMFIGTREQLEKIFAAAGWASAEELNVKSGLETVRAIAENRGYKEAPMSVLLLDGQKPEMVFQKQNNTFAKRHHLRVFKRPELFEGRPVWVASATHDIGISFSAENRTFIHRIDTHIDHERAKVVFDLLFTGGVRGLALVDRPAVPTLSANATGDRIETDGKMAVLLLADDPGSK